MSSEKVTIFTPTYNRGHILNRCYESLCKQTDKNFTWLIVDDGSKDNTQELIKEWKSEGILDIRYFYQSNSGKHVAHNTAVSLCETAIFVCVDSDDILSNDAVSIIYENWEAVKQNDFLAGIIALKGFTNGKVLGTLMPLHVTYSSLFELYDRYKFKGDTMLIYKTEILKKHLFPVFKNEKFVTEAVVYDQIDQKYNMLLLNKVLYKCEYLDDGYSRNLINVHRTNPQGYLFFLNQRIRFSKTSIDQYNAIAYYLAGKWLIKNKKRNSLDIPTKLYFLAVPKAIIIYSKPFIKKFLLNARKNVYMSFQKKTKQ